MENSIVDRLKKYCVEHPDVVQNGLIKGLDSATGKVVIVKNNNKMSISIDELENGFLFNNTQNLNVNAPTQSPSEPEVVEVMEVNESPEEIEMLEEQPQNVASENNTKEINTLNDMQMAIFSKDEQSVDKALEKFSIDEKSGMININKAISIITDNSVNNVANAIKNNTILSRDLKDYDIVGKPIRVFEQNQLKNDLQSLVDTSFNNVLVYVEAAKLKNVVYSPEQIQQAKSKYKTKVEDRINVLGLNRIEKENPTVTENEKIKELKPDTNIKKAGFADILILTIIVLIYAAIIINLISKLK